MVKLTLLCMTYRLLGLWDAHLVVMSKDVSTNMHTQFMGCDNSITLNKAHQIRLGEHRRQIRRKKRKLYSPGSTERLAWRQSLPLHAHFRAKDAL